MKLLTSALLLLSTMSFGQYKGLSKNDYNKALTFAEKSMGQYMVNNRIAEPVIVDTISSWKGFELKLYTYKMTGDKLNEALGKDLIGKVILCNPGPEKLVKWSVNALIKCKETVNYANVLQVLTNIKKCSGAQFPVRGVVYEDIAPENGTNETYAFFDGVTVEGSGIKISTADKERLKPDQELKYLTMTEKKIDSVKEYGRISSTTRNEYRLINKTADTSGKNWVKIVRQEYQKALNSDENNLLYATILADKNLKPDHKDKKFHFQK